jgi:hypothetical protein
MGIPATSACEMWCYLLLILCGHHAAVAFVLPYSALSTYGVTRSTASTNVRLAPPPGAQTRLHGRVSLDDYLFFSGSGDDEDERENDRAYDDDDDDDDEQEVEELDAEHVDVAIAEAQSSTQV